MNASPAPIVSTTATRRPGRRSGTRVLRHAVAPAAPSVTTTSFGPSRLHSVATSSTVDVGYSHSLTPNDFPNLQALTDRLTTFAEHYPTIARPFDWTFTRNDLNQVLAKIADREPDLRLAA